MSETASAATTAYRSRARYFRSTSASIDGGQMHPACQRCHARKKKCDRERPSCSNCLRSEVDCRYDVFVSLTDNGSASVLATLRAENRAQKVRIEELEHGIRQNQLASHSTHHPSGGENTVGAPLDSVEIRRPSDLSFAERIVEQIVNAEMTHHDTGESLLMNIWKQLGLPIEELEPSPALSVAPSTSDEAPWPARDIAEKMVEYYFLCTNPFYPLLIREDIDEDLRYFYGLRENEGFRADRLESPDFRLFRLFLIFAIGCNVLAAAEERRNSSLMRRYAFRHFPSALRADEITCLTSLSLICYLCIIDFAATNPYQVIRLVVRLAVGLGFHKDDPSLPPEKREARKKIFWSLFCLDRSISFTLSREMILSDGLVETPLPMTVPDIPAQHKVFIAPLALFHQTCLMRRLQGLVLTEVYMYRGVGRDVTAVFGNCRSQIEAWYDNIPRQASPPNRVHPYFEVNYHLLLVRLLRPSPLFPATAPSRMTALRRSAYKVIQIYGAVKDEHLVHANYVTLSQIITASIALVYTLIESEGDPANLNLGSWRREAVAQMDSAFQLFSAFCSPSPFGPRFITAFNEMITQVKHRLGAVNDPIALPTWVPAGELAEVQPQNQDTFPQPVNQWTWGQGNNLDSAQDMFNLDDNFEELLMSIGLGTFPT